MNTLIQEFKQGDLLYGTKDDREAAVALVSKHHAGFLITADRANNQYCSLAQKGDLEFVLQKLKSTRGALDANMSSDESNTLFAYITTLYGHPRFSPTAMRDKKNLSKLKEEDVLAAQCKAMIKATVLRGGRVHFIVTNSVNQQAPDKTAAYGKAFTSRELRYIYRYWQTEYKHKVLFYTSSGNDFVTCKAPWEGPDGIAWLQYWPKSWGDPEQVGKKA